MGAVLVTIHLNGHSNVLLDAESQEEAQQLQDLLRSLEDDLVRLQAHAEQLGSQEKDALVVATESQAFDTKQKRGRPKGSATGFDPATKDRLIRQARHLRTQGVTWEAIAARTGLSSDTLRRWVREAEANE